MDNEQLKMCPFCGEIAEVVSMLRNDLVRCGNPNCFASRLGFQHSDNWNTRPIEDALRAELAAVRDEYLSAAALVANMHKAALGEVTGPVLGVVEDVANVRAEVSRLQAELEAVAAAGQRDAALAISLYQENQKLKAALDGTHLAFVHASEELQQAREATCEWSQSGDYWDNGSWDSACGLCWNFEGEGPVENDMIYCPKCGKRLVVLPTPPEQEADE